MIFKNELSIAVRTHVSIHASFSWQYLLRALVEGNDAILVGGFSTFSTPAEYRRTTYGATSQATGYEDAVVHHYGAIITCFTHVCSTSRNKRHT